MAAPTQGPSKPLAARVGRPSVTSVLGLALVALLVFWLAVNFGKTACDFVEIALIGLTTGCLYALIALGYTLVYGILELINFAHGDVFMLGGMIAATFVTSVFCLTDTRRGLGAWLLVMSALLHDTVAVS